MLAPYSVDNLVNEIVHQVLEVRQRRMLALLHVQEAGLILLEFGPCFLELASHFIVPLFHAFEHALILVVLVLADLLFCLLDLLLLEG